MLNPTIPVRIGDSMIVHIDSEPTVRTMRAIRAASGDSDAIAIALCAHIIRSWEGEGAPEWPHLGNPQALAIREGILLDLPIRALNTIAEAAAQRLNPPEPDAGK